MDSVRAAYALEVDTSTHACRVSLSSSLYTATFNTTYRDAAQQSIQFVKNFLSNGTMILDTYEIQGCNVMSAGTFTYNGGYFLQGASIYYGNVTQPSAQDVSEYVYQSMGAT